VAILQVAAETMAHQRQERARRAGGGAAAAAAAPGPAAPILQAWALLELQRGNALAATNLLARAVAADPARVSPVMKWAPVRAAAATVGQRRQQQVLRGSGGGGGLAAGPTETAA